MMKAVWQAAGVSHFPARSAVSLTLNADSGTLLASAPTTIARTVIPNLSQVSDPYTCSIHSFNEYMC